MLIRALVWIKCDALCIEKQLVADIDKCVKDCKTKKNANTNNAIIICISRGIF